MDQVRVDLTPMGNDVSHPVRVAFQYNKSATSQQSHHRDEPFSDQGSRVADDEPTLAFSMQLIGEFFLSCNASTTNDQDNAEGGAQQAENAPTPVTEKSAAAASSARAAAPAAPEEDPAGAAAPAAPEEDRLMPSDASSASAGELQDTLAVEGSKTEDLNGTGPPVAATAGTPPPLSPVPAAAHRTSPAAVARAPSPLSGKTALLVATRPTPLVCQLAESLLHQGASVTLAVRHPQDAHYCVRQLRQHLTPEASQQLAASECPLNLPSPASIRQFADAVNSQQLPLHLLLLDMAEGLISSSRRRWYTPEGLAGHAQEGFVGPASLLHLLQPQLARSHTCLLLTSSPWHRLGQVDDLQCLLTTWAAGRPAATQVALLSYVRQLAQHLKDQGVTAAAVDVGVLRDQPLSGSLVRKVPPLHQLLHLLLPSAKDSAHLITSIAEHMITHTTPAAAVPAPQQQQQQQQGERPAAADEVGATLTGRKDMEGQSLAAGGQQEQQQEGAPGDAVVGVAGGQEQLGPAEEAAAAELGEQEVGGGGEHVETHVGEGEQAGTGSRGWQQQQEEDKEGKQFQQQQEQQEQWREGADAAKAAGPQIASPAAGPSKGFSYFSRGLLATPLLTSLDHAGRSNWLTLLLSQLAWPWYQLTAASVITAAQLLDWPLRAWLLTPAGLVTAWSQKLLGSRALALVAQLQRMVPGVVGVPEAAAAPEWVEVLPSGLVTSDKLGQRVWDFVDQHVQQQ